MESNTATYIRIILYAQLLILQNYILTCTVFGKRFIGETHTMVDN